jgi:ribosomal protein S27E
MKEIIDFGKLSVMWTKIAAIVTENEPLPSTELEGVACPECGAETITFSFSIKKNLSITESFYITCRTCRGLEQYMHYTLGNKPKGFSEHLIIPYYQRIEDWVQNRDM